MNLLQSNRSFFPFCVSNTRNRREISCRYPLNQAEPWPSSSPTPGTMAGTRRRVEDAAIKQNIRNLVNWNPFLHRSKNANCLRRRKLPRDISNHQRPNDGTARANARKPQHPNRGQQSLCPRSPEHLPRLKYTLSDEPAKLLPIFRSFSTRTGSIPGWTAPPQFPWMLFDEVD